MCKHSHSTHAPSPPSGGAFGALLCRKEFLLNCSSHSPQIIDLRPRSCGATVLLSATFSGNGCACCRAGFGSKEQRLLQTPDLVVLLISYLLKCSYCRRSGACGQCGLGGGHCAASGGFISMQIFISFLIPSVICWLFSSVLFSLHMLEFLIVFLL